MDAFTIAAASGMRARLESLDMLANDMANGSTSGFKTDREFYSLYMAPQLEEPSTATLPVVEKTWTDFSQGTLHNTDKPLDVALYGPGFLVANGPSGPLYTRDGALQISSKGTLITGDGYAVQSAAGQPIQVSAQAPVEIGSDGTVRQGGTVAGQLAVVSFADTGALAKHGNGYYEARDANVKPSPAAATTTVQQGKLESSNVNVADSAVRLVTLMRQFEMLQKAVTMNTEMGRKLIDEVAHVGS